MSKFYAQRWLTRLQAAWARLRVLAPARRIPYRVHGQSAVGSRQSAAGSGQPARPLPNDRIERGASVWKALRTVRARRWIGWALVGVMSVVLLIQISVLTTRAYAVYDLEAARTRLLRERSDLVLQLGAAQPLGGLAEAAADAGLQPAAPEQWTIVTVPSQEAHP